MISNIHALMVEAENIFVERLFSIVVLVFHPSLWKKHFYIDNLISNLIPAFQLISNFRAFSINVVIGFGYNLERCISCGLIREIGLMWYP